MLWDFGKNSKVVMLLEETIEFEVLIVFIDDKYSVVFEVVLNNSNVITKVLGHAWGVMIAEDEVREARDNNHKNDYYDWCSADEVSVWVLREE